MSAKLSLCGTFRYELSRNFGNLLSETSVLFIMLNPSTADASVDDPTIRRCIGYAKEWGHSFLTVVNLFSYRATDPKDLLARLERGEDCIGPEGDEAIRNAVEAHSERGDYIIAAWGSMGSEKLIKPRRDAVLRMLPVADVMCLQVCKTGDPKHPLYCRSSLGPTQYEFPRSAWQTGGKS